MGADTRWILFFFFLSPVVVDRATTCGWPFQSECKWEKWGWCDKSSTWKVYFETFVSRRISRKRRVEDVGETQRRRVECLDGSVGKMFDWQPKVPGSNPSNCKIFLREFFQIPRVCISANCDICFFWNWIFSFFHLIIFYFSFENFRIF